MEWDSGFLERSPMFEPLRAHGAALSAHAAWPSRAALDRLLAGHGVRTGPGLGLRLVDPSAGREAYESRVYRAGELQHREGDWHDLFNVLAWLAYPETKAALNAAHEMSMGALRAGPGRGRRRDALTVFDESGAIVASSDASLLEDVRAFRWKRLFWERRERVRASMRVYVFGHAVFEKALNPYVGMTAHALLIEVDDALIASPLQSQIETVDAVAAARIAAVASPRELSPLPLLGVPGWWAENAREDFYDNESYFRPGRAPRDRHGASAGASR